VVPAGGPTFRPPQVGQHHYRRRVAAVSHEPLGCGEAMQLAVRADQLRCTLVYGSSPLGQAQHTKIWYWTNLVMHKSNLVMHKSNLVMHK